MVKPNVIAIIPARGGSKRIPKKNIKPFKGKPMIAWTIEEAKNTEIFDRVIVSTDDEEIRSVAKEYGAEVPFLRQESYDDISPVSVATLHALEQAEEHYQEKYDVVVQLMANCPLRTGATISAMFTEFQKSEANSMLSHTRYGWLNPWWAAEIDADQNVKPVFEEKLKERSQDLSELVCPTGAIWIADVEALKAHKTFHIPNKKAYIMDWKEAVDIDDMDDWAMADLVYEQIKK